MLPAAGQNIVGMQMNSVRVKVKLKVKVKQSSYRPGVAQRVPVS